MTIFLDFRTKEDFNKESIKEAINIPLADFLLGPCSALDKVPRNVRIEYYYPVGIWDGAVKNKLFKLGFMNVHNRGDIAEKPKIYVYKSPTTLRPVEQKEERITKPIIF